MPCFKSIIFYQYSPKTKLFFKKNAKFSSAGGSAPRPPIASGGWGLCPRPPKQTLNCEFLATHLSHFALFIIIWVFVAFVLNNFFLHRSVAKLVMLTIIDVCLMLNCIWFEKIYLHYALWDFDSILLHCTKLFIRQSIDREQIFDVTFETPPTEKSCLRHWLQQ